MSRKVLLVCYYFPPMGLAGVSRPINLFKKLPQYRYDCHVLTVKPVTYWAYEPGLLEGLDAGKIYRSGSRDPQRIMYLLGVRKIKASTVRSTARVTDKFFPDAKVGWVKPALRLGRTITENNDYDLIISTSPPVSTHLIAMQLSLEFDIPWLADFRDLWSVFPIERTYSSQALVDRGKKLLKDIMLKASAITAVNGSIAKYVNTNHVIANGFDSFVAENWRFPPDESRFVIGILGSQHRGRLIAPLFTVLAALRKQYPEEFERIRLVQVGDIDREWWPKQLAGADLLDRCDTRGYLPRIDCIKALSGASLLYIGLTDDLDPETVPSRVFDMLASGRPLLAAARSGSAVCRLVHDSGNGRCFDQDTAAAAVEYVRGRIREQLVGRQVITPLPEFAQRFSSDVMVRKFAEMLDTL